MNDIFENSEFDINKNDISIPVKWNKTYWKDRIIESYDKDNIQHLANKIIIKLEEHKNNYPSFDINRITDFICNSNISTKKHFFSSSSISRINKSCHSYMSIERMCRNNDD